MKKIFIGVIAASALIVNMTSFALEQERGTPEAKVLSDIFFNSARASFSRGDLSEGTELLKQAVISNPANVLSNELMVDVVYNYARRGEIEKAKELIRFCQENFTEGEYLSWSKFVEAEIAADQLRLDEALSLLENIITEDLTPKYQAMSHALLGAIYVEKRKWDEAEENLGRSLKLFPDNKTALNDLAVVNINRGKYPEAIDLLVKAYDMDPSYVMAQQNIMHLNQRLKHFKKYYMAIKLAEGVIGASKDKDSAFIKGAKIELADAYLLNKETDKAKAIMERFIEDNPDEKDRKGAYRIMMASYAAERNIRKAEEYAARGGTGFYLLNKVLELIAGFGIGSLIILLLFCAHRLICRFKKISVYKGREFRFLHIWIVFSTFFLIFPMVSVLTNIVLFRSFTPDFNFDISSLLFMNATTSIFLWALIAGLFAFKKYNMRPLELGLLKPSKPFLFRSALIVAGVGAFGAAYKYIVTDLLSIPEPLSVVEGIMRDLRSPFSFGFVFLAGIVLIPVFEEFIYRGFFYEAFKRHSGVVGGAVFSSCLFAFSHTDTFPYSFLPITIFGFGLAYIRQRTGSLIPAIFIHVMNNFLALALIYFKA